MIHNSWDIDTKFT